MGRLENFIPKIAKYKVSQSHKLATLLFNGSEPIPVHEDVVSFVKQINGHLSLREIFLFLNEKGERLSIDKSLSLLKNLANAGHLLNSDDFYQVMHGGAPGHQKGPRSSAYKAEYFSKERLVALLQKTTLFLRCERAVAESILQASKLEKVEPEQVVIQEGTKSSEFFVLLAGEMGVYQKENWLATLGPLTVFGESAAIFDKLRNADVMSHEPSWLLRVNADRILDTKSPETFEAFKGLKSRLILNQTLSANNLFRALPTDVMQLFISQCRIEKYSREQRVIEQGEASGDFYFILKGSVSIIKDGMPVTSLTEGDHFGEVAAMLREPRTASVICETASTFLVLSQKQLMDVLCCHFRLAIDIERTARERKESKKTLFEIFKDEAPQKETTSPVFVSMDELSQSNINVDDEFFETSSSHFDLELVDFSDYSSDDETF
jgi:CRP-like cAMP-binding protein